jgi:hypothetical protein
MSGFVLDFSLTVKCKKSNVEGRNERPLLADSVIPTVIEQRPASASTAEEGDQKYIVDWDGPGDPANPLNWPPGKKWANLAIISSFTLITCVHFSSFPSIPSIGLSILLSYSVAHLLLQFLLLFMVVVT